MRKKLMVVAAAVAVAALALAGCASSGGDSNGGADKNQGLKVVAFTTGNQVPIGTWWMEQVQKDAADNGWDIQAIPGDFNVDKMTTDVQTAMAGGVDVLFDGYTDYQQIGAILTAAKDAGAPVFAVDAGTEATDDFMLNVTTDQQGIVDLTVDAIDKKIGGLKGKTVMVIGHDPHAGIRLRSELAVKAFEAAGATIAGGGIQKVQNPGTGKEESLKFVTDFVAANPGQLAAVWTGWDGAAAGAAQGVTESGANAVVTGVDFESSAKEAILSGTSPWFASVSQPWPAIQQTVVNAIVEWAKNGTVPAQNFIAEAVTLVTAENANDVTPSDQLS